MNPFQSSLANVHVNPWGQNLRFDTQLQTTDRKASANFLMGFKPPSVVDMDVQFGDNVSVDVRAFHFAGLQVIALRYGTEVSVRIHAEKPDADQPWLFVYTLDGQAIGKRLNTQAGPGHAGAYQINGPADYSLSANYEALMLKVSAQDVLRTYQALHGDQASPDYKLSMTVPAGSSAALTLLRTITRLSETPKYTHEAAHRFERSLKESALLEILMNWPAVTAPSKPECVLPASTRLAKDFIHAHISELPTVSDVAASCRIGVRALDRGFKKHLGVSPLQYMLDLRLQGVHDDLIAQRHGKTVTDVAIYWGFSNLGVFAARYRERFGELPSETLRQSRQLSQYLN